MRIRTANLMKFLTVFSLMWLTCNAFAASFNCAKAKSEIEKMICQDPQSSKLDEKLQHTYKKALDAIDPASKDALIKEQRHWIDYTRNICQNESCLQQAYTARIDLLAKNQRYIVDRSVCEIPDGKTCRSVIYMRDPNDRIKSFNKSMVNKRQPGHIIGCTKLIDLPAGSSDGNDSFGGVCLLQEGVKRRTVEICNDDMIGHFMMKDTSPNLTDKKIIEFTNLYCYGS